MILSIVRILTFLLKDSSKVFSIGYWVPRFFAAGDIPGVILRDGFVASAYAVRNIYRRKLVDLRFSFGS